MKKESVIYVKIYIKYTSPKSMKMLMLKYENVDVVHS